MTLLGFDAFSPAEIARRVAEIGVSKARLPLPEMLMLAVLAGSFVGLGAMYFTLVVSDPSLPPGLARVLGGVCFSLGLILVVLAGAELFTGNNLLVMAWMERGITTHELVRNWIVVAAGNLVGAVGLALLVWLADHATMQDGAIASTVLEIVKQKTALDFVTAFFRGVLCNVLVCLAVWLAMAGRSVTDKLLAIVFPISAFVAAGFEHSVANFYFLALASLLEGDRLSPMPWHAVIGSQLAVLLGNVFGGAVLVGAVYHVIYRRALRTGKVESNVPGGAREPAGSGSWPQGCRSNERVRKEP